MNDQYPLFRLGLMVLCFGLCNSKMPAADNVPKSDIATAEILKRLRSLPQTDGWPIGHYHDMHGNANEELQTLMIRRFDATLDICKELDTVSAKSHPAYVASLYRVLSTVKDPASIPWLERSLRSSKKGEICRYWLVRWSMYLRGAAPTQLRWLTGVDQWSKFFRAWADSETNETDHLRVLRAMQGWLHDPATQDSFVSLERTGKCTDEELLLVQLYLRQHGKPFDEAKLRATITRLHKSSDGKRILLRYAAATRHEAFLPSLLEVVDDEVEEEFMTPQRAVEAITFQHEITGSRSWKKWYDTNGRKGRAAWMKEAASQLTLLATTNMPAAKNVLSKVKYNWDDPAMLPYMEKLASFKELHNDIAGWINLTYHEVPFLRNRLLPLALKIRDESGESLEPWAKNLMREWDFLENDQETWEKKIRMDNSCL